MSFSEKEKSPTNGSVEPFLRLLSLAVRLILEPEFDKLEFVSP